MCVLAAAVGFVLGFDRVITGFSIMAIALLLASFAMRRDPGTAKGRIGKTAAGPVFCGGFHPRIFHIRRLI